MGEIAKLFWTEGAQAVRLPEISRLLSLSSPRCLRATCPMSFRDVPARL